MKERNNFKKKALFHVTKVLWHLDIFRRSFRELSGHACMADSCIFCALKDLFGQLQFSHERALPPDALRKALAQSFSDQHRFQLGFMDDAAECFENILLRIHFHIAYNEAEDMCNAKHCIPHQKFAMTLVEQSVCGVCHATSEPLPFTQMVHYVSASALISQAKQFVGTSHPDLFGQLLKKAGGMGDIRDCPSACGAKIQIRRTLINRPEIVSVGIVWDSDRPSLEHIMSLLDTLRIHLRLSDVFHGSFDVHHADNVYHQLVGVVTYYGKHYSTFFFHTKLRVWVYFDDANVREVGPHWQDVVEKCRRGRYQPLLLLFATPNGTPVDASHAPKSVTLVDKPAINLCNGHDIVGKPPIQRCSLSPTGSLALGGRRSLTPSPEKPRSGDGVNQRRAVTPNPEQSTNQINEKSVLPNNDYQNLVQYQDVIFNRSNICEDESDRKPDIEKRIHPVRKELSRRDSGNWSGDRNSASSSSSTSLENPYHYIIGKMHLKTYGGIPRSPNKNGDLSSGSGNSSGGPADPGYDSFSLSSTDSLPIQQNLKYNFQLAQIPENQQTPAGSNHIIDENTRVADDCERLCAEVDQLLDRSEQAEDLITALSLCNAAVNKARAAMDAPYSNPQTASFATMKHNACILRARSLHRKLEEPLHNNLKYGENRHSREGSGCSGRGSTGSHSRQNSKDKGNHGHSRQNSVELLDIHSNNNQPTKSVIQPMKTSPDLKSSNDKISTCKNIEIYATLPKNKKSILSRSSPKVKNVVEDEEYLMKERPGRSLLGNRSKTNKKEIEKRTRSEERNTKNVKEVAVVTTKEKEKEQKELKKQAKQEEKQNKKQHKIRRKLLMGGLMRRKNRSMPDLRDEEGMTKELPKTSSVKETSKDDSMVNSKTAIQSNLSGYLSEGNLEYNGNPNLERSKLMRKSFHGSKIIPFNKVPPPPPLRTTSQLSKTDRILNDPRNIETSVYAKSRSWCQEPASLPFLPRNYEDEKPNTDAVTYSKGGYLLQQSSMNTVVTEAQIHHDASFQSLPSSTDEPDFINKVEDINFQLPPYPSPIHSTVHSRQASEDFPPPPATLPPPELESDFLIMLQEKCERMGIMEMNSSAAENEIKKPTGGESWLKELQAKQAERRKLNDQIESISINGNESKNVKDMKSKFEQMQVIDEVDYISKLNGQIHLVKESVRSPPSSVKAVDKCESHSNLKISNSYDMEDDKNGFEGKEQKRKSGKKKNVTFCEQVVLVATADDEEADSYIPNPILERVLRSVLHKESNFENKEHAVHSVVPLKRTDSMRLSQGLPLKPQLEGEDVVDGTSMQKDTTRSLNMRSANTINSSTRGNFVSEPVDEVDGPCVMNQTYGDGKAIVKQNTNSYVNSHQAYSPTYIPASSLCLPSKNEHRNEYSEQAVLLNESNISQNGYIDSHNEQSNNGISQNQPIRKFNENYSSADNLRYSPICNQEVSHHNGFHSTYSPYQSVPTSYSNSASSSYQPMSLQYYPTQSRSSPQITTYRDQLNQGNVKTSLSSNSLSSSLSRQNSTASHYNKQLTAVDPRRLPVSSISPQASMSSTSRLSDCQRSQYYNMPQYSQKSTNSVTAYQSTLNGNCSPYGYNNDTSKCISNSSMNGQQNLLNSSGISHNLHQQYSPSISTHQIHAQQSNTCHVSQCSPNSQYTSSSLNHSNLSGHQVHNSTSSSSYNIPTISSSQPQYTSNSSNNQHNSNSCGIPQSTQNQHYSSNVSHPHVSSQQYSTHSTNFSHQGSSNSSVAAQLHQNIPSQQHLPNLNHGNSHVSNNSMHQQSLHQNLPSHLTNGNSHQNINVQQNGSSNCDSLPRNSTPLMAPYQSIPYNSNVYEVYSRNSYNGTSSAYQHVPYGSTNGVNSNPSNQQHQTKMQHRANLPPVYQHPPPPPPNSKSSVYQRVPTPNQKIRTNEYNNTSSTNKYFPYQHPPMPKQMDSKKTNAAVPCNLCRKKQISPPSVYCTDCDFYISRFKQKV